MIRYTNEFLTDGDITIERVANRLKLISEGIKNSNKLNLCDINVICEEIFGKILNTLYGYELVTIGVQGKPHYVAIDLVDKKNKVAYQVTSTVRRSKIEGTTEKFVKNKLYKDIDELYILILNDDPHKYRNDNNEIDIKTTKKFTIKNNVINFEKLITEIETKSKNNPKLLTKIWFSKREDCLGKVLFLRQTNYHKKISIIRRNIIRGKRDLGMLVYLLLFQKVIKRNFHA